MIEMRPDDQLSMFIDSYWKVSAPTSSYSETPMPPCGYPIVEFNLGHAWDFKVGNKEHKGLSHVAIGVNDQPINLVSNDNVESVLVRFKPWALPALCNEQGIFNLRDVFGNSVDDTAERLVHQDDPADIKSTLDAFFLDHLNPDSIAKANPVIHSINLILASNGIISLERILADLSIGQKRLEQLFKEFIGLSPKSYIGIARLNNAIRLLNSAKTLTALSLQAGYYDQSHFVRECKKKTGTNPLGLKKNEHFQQERHISNLYNF